MLSLFVVLAALTVIGSVIYAVGAFVQAIRWEKADRQSDIADVWTAMRTAGVPPEARRLLMQQEYGTTPERVRNVLLSTRVVRSGVKPAHQ
jgi:hypothetical protein